MGFLRQWLLGVIACALLVSMIEQLCPEGSVRRAARFTGALLLLLAMLRLPTALQPEAAGVPGYREAVARLELELDATRKNAMADGIARSLDAYIEDKAASLGADVRAEVRLRGEGEALLPEAVTLHGAYSAALSDYLADELNLPKERQTWIEND